MFTFFFVDGKIAFILKLFFTKNFFFVNKKNSVNFQSNVMVPNVLSHPMPSLPPRRPISGSMVPSTHSTISHQSHFSPKSNTSSTIEPSQDSVSPPLIVDSIENVPSPISVNSNSNNNNNITPKNNHKNNSDTQSTNNNITTDNTNTKSNDGLVSSSSFNHNGLRNEQQNSLLDILMNPDKCQVQKFSVSFSIADVM